MPSPHRLLSPASAAPLRPTRLLQRSCACGGSCEACAQKRLLQRNGGVAGPALAPPAVEAALASPGRPLDAGLRGHLEPRFGRDLSQVRVHTDAPAAASASAVGARAYTVGRDLVFGPGQYRPETPVGLRLLAHELSHAAQQGMEAGGGAPIAVGSPGSTQEREADDAADRVANGERANLGRAPRALQRALLVDQPGQKTAAPAGQNAAATNAEVVEGYLKTLAPDGGIHVDRGSGRVSMNEEFCRGRGARFLNRWGRGFVEGAKIGAYFLGVGALPGLIIGGLVGLVQGIAAAASGPESQAAASGTPTGSTCLCDFVNGKHDWVIEIDDSDHPRTLNTHRVRVPSPNAPKIWGAATTSGKLQNMEPWLLLGHELCGHAWLEEHNTSGGDEEGLNPKEDARHHRTVERENALRAEHGLEPRGFRLKDPFCGESFFRDRSKPDGPAQFDQLYDEKNKKALKEMGRGDEANDTYLDDCRRKRIEAFGDKAKDVPVEERIP